MVFQGAPLVLPCRAGGGGEKQGQGETSRGRRGRLDAGAPPRRAGGDRTVFGVHEGVKSCS